MPARTEQQSLRSLALHAALTAQLLDGTRSGRTPGGDFLLAGQFRHLLGALGRLGQWPAAALHGQVAPGAGTHMLEVLASIQPAPASPAGLDVTPHPPAHPELRALVEQLSAILAAGRIVHSPALFELAGHLAGALADITIGQLHTDAPAHSGPDCTGQLSPPVTTPGRDTSPTRHITYYGRPRCGHVGRCHCR